MGAPKGNKYALGNKGGRPAFFDNPDELELFIDGYFLECTEKKLNPTISGLCLFCGFENRKAFYDYGKKKEFSYIIKRARLHIEMIYEERLHGNSPAGAIFALKNFGWKDEKFKKFSGKVKTTSTVIVQDSKTKGEVEKLMNEDD